MFDPNFEQFKAYREIMNPVIKLDHARKNKVKGAGITLAIILIIGSLIMGLAVHGFCCLMVELPHAWLCVK